MKTRIYFVLIILLFILSCTKESTSPDDSLTAPSNLTLEQIDLESIQLNWQDNSSAEEGFRIDRKIGENEWEENYQTLPENSTAFIDSELIEITNYSYRIRAFADEEYSEFTEASIDFFYDDVSYLDPLYNWQISLSPLEPFEFQVALKDSNGNNVQRIYDVWFKFLSKPEGTNINNSLYNTTDSISVQTIDGIASVTLYAGNESGTASLKIYTYNSNNEEISIIKSNIPVHSYAPETIELSISGINSRENLGNGNWGIEVSAYIEDILGNPVEYGTSVYYSLPDNPEWASIEAASYTGNENANGDSIPGVAYTQLIYEGAHTNDTLIIQAETGWCSETDEFIMPLQFPVLYGYASPAHLDWSEYTPSDSLIGTFIINLQDGQNNPIDNQQLLFYCELGLPIDMGTDNDNDPFTENTGIILNQHGRINKEWIFYRDECPPPVGNVPGTITVMMLVSITGTSIEIEIPIVLIRYPGY
ncbi:MAG: fibronectin type III domain-containing protein [Candidatus Cloacimonetes bacterium]|nr:fibronectin type III domain-containing protein [Candidatus Cloacimonadota bacterium]